MLARLRSRFSTGGSSPLKYAMAGGVAFSAYLLNNENSVRAAEPQGHIFVINGFYMAMREKYTKPGASIHYYLVEWDQSKLSWEDFRGKVLGATDPATASDGSLRKEIFTNWQKLGLKSEPDVGDNGVHASASPFEALAERLNWVGASLEEDDFGKAMIASGIPKEKIREWTKDPQVLFEGKKSSLFDLLEDLDYDECLSKAKQIAGVTGQRPPGKMQAFVFLKPHAVTDSAKELVVSRFAEVGITVTQEGSLDAKQIEQDKLIDNHYYAIANKASLSKPAELNPPAAKQEAFHKLFGISWKQALADGLVYNAVDGCKRLGVDGLTMNKQWATTKKAGDLVKFGGGFYAGRIPLPKEESSHWFTSVALALYALLRK